MGRGTHSEQTHDFPFRKCCLNQTSSVEKNKDSLAESGCVQCIKMGLGKRGRGTLRMPEKGLQDGTIFFFLFLISILAVLHMGSLVAARGI